MKKKRLLMLVIIAASIFWWWHRRYPAVINEVKPQVIVKAEAVKTANLPIIIQTVGSVVASKTLNISPEVAGHIEHIYFQDGSYVKAGTPLIKLDDEIEQVRLASAQAKLTYLKNSYQRLAALAKKGIIAQQAIDQAEADLKQQQAERDAAKVAVEKHLLLAPFSGTVAKANIQIGDYVTIGQNLVNITDNQHLRIEYNVPEHFLSQLKIGQLVKIFVSAYPNQHFNAELAYKAPTINTSNRSIDLYANLDNKDNLLAPGMFVNIEHSLATERQVILVPTRSLVPILGGEQIYKYVNGRALAINVEVGMRNPKEVQITHGLEVGDKIITDGQLKIQNGMPVKLQT